MLTCEAMLKSGAMTGTLLFTGANQQEKVRFSFDLIKGLFGTAYHSKIDSGNHPDVHILQIEGKSGMHSVAALREMLEEVSLPPYEAPLKVFLIYDAERMLPTGSNTLLKTLEEPPFDSLIILLSSQPKDLLPTIVSRCRIFRFDFSFNSVPNDQLVAILSKFHDPAQMLKLCDALEESIGGEEDSPKKMQQLDALYEQILYWYRDLHLLEMGGDRQYLYHKEYLPQLEKAEQKKLPQMEKLLHVVERGRLASQRYTRLRHIMEYILLLQS